MPTPEIVHPVPLDELPAWRARMFATFLSDPASETPTDEVGLAAYQRVWAEQRHWGARDDGRWVATLATLPRTLTVPGLGAETGLLAADALSMVTVAATHRRQGLLTTLISQSLTAARQRGDAVSILFSGEWPIYGRFGYAPAETSARYEYSPRGRGATVAPSGLGRLRTVEPAEFAEIAPAVYERARRFRAGQIDRPTPTWWQRTLGLGGFPRPSDTLGVNLIVREGSAGPDGYVAWSPTVEPGMDGTNGTVTVNDLQATSDEAYRDLWAYLSGLDVVGTVVLGRRPVDEPIRQLLGDGRALRLTYAGDGVWLRLLDVPAALSARRYATAGRVAFEVHDDAVGSFAAGRYVLDGGPDGASCTLTSTETAELRLDQRALASAYLGGASLRQQLISGQVEELVPGALGRFDAMLATSQPPWCATMF